MVMCSVVMIYRNRNSLKRRRKARTSNRTLGSLWHFGQDVPRPVWWEYSREFQLPFWFFLPICFVSKNFPNKWHKSRTSAEVCLERLLSLRANHPAVASRKVYATSAHRNQATDAKWYVLPSKTFLSAVYYLMHYIGWSFMLHNSSQSTRTKKGMYKQHPTTTGIQLTYKSYLEWKNIPSGRLSWELKIIIS